MSTLVGDAVLQTHVSAPVPSLFVDKLLAQQVWAPPALKKLPLGLISKELLLHPLPPVSSLAAELDLFCCDRAPTCPGLGELRKALTSKPTEQNHTPTCSGIPGAGRSLVTQRQSTNGDAGEEGQHPRPGRARAHATSALRTLPMAPEPTSRRLTLRTSEQVHRPLPGAEAHARGIPP